MPSDCPSEVCRCDDWPPDECPQCGVQTLGFTPEDWWVHFRSDCDLLGQLYCFAEQPEGVSGRAQ